MRRRPTLAALLCAAVLAGCGGDPGPQTKEGFVAAADGVCQKAAERLAEEDAEQPTTPQEVADANRTLARIYGRLSDDLAEVELPEAGAGRQGAQRFVASVRAADPALARLRAASDAFVAAARKNDERAITRAGNDVRSALDAFRAARATSDELAIDLGLNLCGNLG